MVECTALEMRHTREGIVGSNPTLSAIYPFYRTTKEPKNLDFQRFLAFSVSRRPLPSLAVNTTD